MTQPALCLKCQSYHDSSWAQPVGRFAPDGTQGHMSTITPGRATYPSRALAEAAGCAFVAHSKGLPSDPQEAVNRAVRTLLTMDHIYTTRYDHNQNVIWAGCSCNNAPMTEHDFPDHLADVVVLFLGSDAVRDALATRKEAV